MWDCRQILVWSRGRGRNGKGTILLFGEPNAKRSYLAPEECLGASEGQLEIIIKFSWPPTANIFHARVTRRSRLSAHVQVVKSLGQIPLGAEMWVSLFFTSPRARSICNIFTQLQKV